MINSHGGFIFNSKSLTFCNVFFPKLKKISSHFQKGTQLIWLHNKIDGVKGVTLKGFIFQRCAN